MNTLTQQLKNLETQPIIFGDEVGRGGEGIVFAIKNSPNLVVKVYHQAPSRDKAEKILAMIRLRNERLLKLSTWPLASYYSDRGILSGFIMSRLTNNYSLYELYNPRLRLEKFPKADWRFLVHAATNVARAFSVIHDAGHVIGDVNHGNLVVAEDATVRFIDTDSFQIIDNKKFWFCEVGVLTHQPPEMQGLTTFSGVMRTPNHDNFGLAVLIFQLLFLARHPFSGRFQGKGEMPLEQAIKEYRFAFSSYHHILQMLPPPASLQMGALTPNLRLLFERAFSKEGSGAHVGLRPTSNEWITALSELAVMLKSCSLNGGHYYYKGLNKCPWCDIETICGSLLFPVVHVEDTSSNIDFSSSNTSPSITAIWQRAEAIIDPGPEPLPPLLVHQSLPPSLKAQSIQEELKPLRVYTWGGCFLVLLITILLAFLGSGWTFLGLVGMVVSSLKAITYYTQRKEELVKDIIIDYSTIMQDWENLMSKWKIPGSAPSFASFKKRINDLKKTYDYIDTGRELLVQQLRDKLYTDQLSIHLKNFHIANANIEGIGPARIRILKSHGIETAANVEEHCLLGIQGFGAVFRMRLISWRQQIENHFAFQFQSIKLSSQDTAAIERVIALKRNQITFELDTITSQLSTFTLQVHEQRRKNVLEVNMILLRYSQVIVDAKTIGLEL